MLTENKVRNFYSLNLSDLETLFKVHGKEKFRAQQLFKWVYEKRVSDPEQMTNLSKDFRKELGQYVEFSMPTIVQHLKSVDGTQNFYLISVTLKRLKLFLFLPRIE